MTHLVIEHFSGTCMGCGSDSFADDSSGLIGLPALLALKPYSAKECGHDQHGHQQRTQAELKTAGHAINSSRTTGHQPTAADQCAHYERPSVTVELSLAPWLGSISPPRPFSAATMTGMEDNPYRSPAEFEPPAQPKSSWRPWMTLGVFMLALFTATSYYTLKGNKRHPLSWHYSVIATHTILGFWLARMMLQDGVFQKFQNH